MWALFTRRLKVPTEGILSLLLMPSILKDNYLTLHWASAGLGSIDRKRQRTGFFLIMLRINTKVVAGSNL